jgi:hypothetical protein
LLVAVVAVAAGHMLEVVVALVAALVALIMSTLVRALVATQVLLGQMVA